MQKIVISADSLKKALKLLGQAVHKKATLPILSNVFFKVKQRYVELVTSDLEITIIYTLACETEGEHFEFLIPYELISKIVSLSGNIPISIELVTSKKKQGLKIQGANDVYELKSLEDVSQFPKIPTVPQKNSMQLNTDALLWLQRSMETVGMDDLKPAMMKSCLDITENSITIVSTDGNALFSYCLENSGHYTDQLLITPKIAHAIQGFAEANVYWHSKNIAVKHDGITIIATRHEDKYPNYKSVIPNNEDNLSLHRETLIKALERVNLVAGSGRHTTIFLNKSPDTIHFEAEDPALERKVQVDIAGNYTGDIDHLHINAGKMLTLLGQITFDEIRLHIHSQRSGMLITTPEDGCYKSMIMPVIINS